MVFIFSLISSICFCNNPELLLSPPPSPPFIIAQSVLMHDVDEQLSREAVVVEASYLMTTDRLYADDTVLLSSCPIKFQHHLDLLVDEGKNMA